jgi:hypothetical protein
LEENMMMRRMMVAGAVAALALVSTGGAALADHTHVRLLGNGKCVVLAAQGGEQYVELPHAEAHAANRRHPLHVNVHLGQPGTRHGQEVVWVRGSAGVAGAVG